MAQKRMFDKRITESDRFIDLPNSSKALYFMAGMSADDRGFFQPRKLQRECGFSDDDFKILLAKSFIISFPSGVMVITDWNKNNWLDNRRITETEYIDELNMLKRINDKYELEIADNACLANAKPMLSQYSIEENSIEENRVEENSIEESERTFVKINFDSYVEVYNRLCTNLPKIKALTDKRKTAIRKFSKEFSIKDFEQICINANNSGFLIGDNDRGWKADFDFLLRVDKATAILEDKYAKSGRKTEGNQLLDLINGGAFDE